MENGERILEYTYGVSFNAFLETPVLRDATERCLARISEAAVKLGPAAETLLPGYPWQSIRALGNILRHGYELVDMDMVWKIARDHLPSLVLEARAAAARLPQDKNT